MRRFPVLIATAASLALAGTAYAPFVIALADWRPW